MASYLEKRLRDAHTRLKKRGVPLAANQVNYSLIYRTPELNGVKAACDELGITLIAYSPIAQGRNQSLNFFYTIVLKEINSFNLSWAKSSRLFSNLISCSNLFPLFRCSDREIHSRKAPYRSTSKYIHS